jgi:hypothetical protein
MTTLGTVTKEELNLLEIAFRKKISLESLFVVLTERKKTLTSSDSDFESMYNRMVDDYGKAQMEINKWWKDMSSKYQWKGDPKGRWNVDFSTGLVSLIVPNNELEA